MIQFTKVSKTYDTGTDALHNVTLKIDKGEFRFCGGPFRRG